MTARHLWEVHDIHAMTFYGSEGAKANACWEKDTRAWQFGFTVLVTTYRQDRHLSIAFDYTQRVQLILDTYLNPVSR